MVEERASSGVEDLSGVVPQYSSVYKVSLRKFRKSEVEPIFLYEDEKLLVQAEDASEAHLKGEEYAKILFRNDSTWNWTHFEIRGVEFVDSLFIDAHWVGGPSPSILTSPSRPSTWQDVEAEADSVNHPPHYTFGKFEVIDVIEDWKLGYHLGNAIKYIARSDHKGKRSEDLKKSIWYLQRAIELEES